VWLDTLVVAMLSRPDWQLDAACRDLPVDWFFPEQGPNAWHDLRQAVAVCQECPVIADCLNYALSLKLEPFPAFGEAHRKIKEGQCSSLTHPSCSVGLSN
jgi:hypothetical protein